MKLKQKWYRSNDFKLDSQFKKNFAKLKFSPALFEKVPSFVWCLKLKINEF